MTEVSGEILLVLLLIALNGLLAMSEIAVVSARKGRLRQRAEEGDRGAATALDLAEEPTRFLSTVQIGITLVGILAGAFGGATIAEQIGAALDEIPSLAPYGEAIGLAIVVTAITYLSLVFGELVPKRIGLTNAESIAALMARPMQRLSTLTGPLVSLLTGSTDLVIRLLRLRTVADTAVTEEDVRMMIAEGAETGVFEAAEREIVESVFQLGDRRVGELMTPRPRIVWLDVEDPPEENWQRIAASAHSFYPVATGDLDRLVGLLAMKVLSTRLLAGEPPDLTSGLLQPPFVPESMPVFKLLDLFRTVSPRVAMVVDEHGTIIGLVTPTDILEGIVGDLPEPGVPEDIEVVRREDGSLLVDGLLPVDELDELLDVGALTPDERGEFRTVGGLVMHHLGRIPTAGDRVAWRGLQLEVMDMDGRRVDKVLVQPAPPAPPDGGADDARL